MHAFKNNKRILRRLKRLAIRFFFWTGKCYIKKEKNQVFFRSIYSTEVRWIIEEIHEGVCGTHANGHTMTRQVMRVGYYWLTLESDCIEYARKCHKCQIYADKIYMPPTQLHVMAPLWPFFMWDMDVIGPITLKASNEHRFIFVVIDYFTKWVKTTSYTSVTQFMVCIVIKKEIICQYGLPKRIISDLYQSE